MIFFNIYTFLHKDHIEGQTCLVAAQGSRKPFILNSNPSFASQQPIFEFWPSKKIRTSCLTIWPDTLPERKYREIPNKSAKKLKNPNISAKLPRNKQKITRWIFPHHMSLRWRPKHHISSKYWQYFTIF